MIELSADFSLGRDTTRIKDPADAHRQTATPRSLLERLFSPDDERRFELQVLADEVGMGKTFVALAVAYSVLAHLARRPAPDDLAGAVRRVVIVTPQNSALFRKWQREVSEFVGRCVAPEHQAEARRWFVAIAVERQDELVAALRRRGPGPRVIVTHTGCFGSARLHHLDQKRRQILGVLFRIWGKRFSVDQRKRLLRGAPAGWPQDPYALVELDEREQHRALFSDEDLRKGLRRLERRDAVAGRSRVEQLLERCREIAQPYVRGREESFAAVERQLVDIYRGAVANLGKKGIPLVIADEAHNWKNGPSNGRNGYRDFIGVIGRRARRILLLTATPFQLRPSEMLELFRISDDIQPSRDAARASMRRSRLAGFREQAIRPALERATATSGSFARAWGRLPARVQTSDLDGMWQCTSLAAARDALLGLAHNHGAVDVSAATRVADDAVRAIDPDLRVLAREALRLFAYNADLSAELGRVVVRHRRTTDHRLVRVGVEFVRPTDEVALRPDRQILHAAAGIDVRGEGELPHYVLMRCVSEMKQGKGRSSLGSDLTGCYSTLLESAEGRKVSKQLAGSPVGARYLALLLHLVDAQRDPSHPKVATVVEAVLRAWRAGEKTLLFCFRTHTAERLRAIIDERIRDELTQRRLRCLGGEERIKTLRSRLTGRDRDLVGIGLDRVLWSFLWAARSVELERIGEWAPCPYAANELSLQPGDIDELSRTLLRFGMEVTGDRPDRVFLHRAHEHVVARRLLGTASPRPWRRLLERIADDEWVARPYGLAPRHESEDEGEESASFDERGAQSVYPVQGEPTAAQVAKLAATIAERRARAGERSLFDTYVDGASLWLGRDPIVTATRTGGPAAPIVQEIHAHLGAITVSGDSEDFEGRLALFQALRRSLLRESVLLRLLPDQSDREESQWGDLLADTFFAPLPGQRESMADRVAVFLEDVRAASGGILESGSARNTLLEATRLRDQQFVALVKGGGDSDTRERIFAGFNSPLLPEVLICTSVGQEGIDLHRHCRNVVHYDLVWNPAVLEQRTGRVDRIGCKTFRERSGDGAAEPIFLEIGVPFLAGTYDERIYEELRLRSQVFEVLTGGDVSVDDAQGRDDGASAEGRELGLHFTPLPVRMVQDLRANLHVWVPGATHMECRA
jgi:hypothetical protein